ncbi:MAG: amidohydrolase family protein [Gammaproteobacteria bacterium]|nr:amidohydrolase family protein [Gammaproteobacteria bacterium]
MADREEVDLLIEPHWLMPMAGSAAVLTGEAVAVSGGRIVALGPAAALRERCAPRQQVQRPHHVLLPGFVSACTQAAQVLLRGATGAARRASLRIDPLGGPPATQAADFVRDGVRLAMAEMLGAGITCFADLSLQPEEVARAVAAGPMRACVGLPVAEAPSAWADGVTAYLARAARLWDEYRSDARISLFFAPLGGAALSEQTLGRVRRVADELEARIALTLRAPEEELVRDAPRLRGATPLEHLAQLGLLRPGSAVCAAEGLGAEDLERLAHAGAALVLGPRAALAAGAARLPPSLPALTALGCETPVVGALDILEEARTAALLGIAPGEALRLATLGGATALGLQAQVGSIEPGKVADLVCIDLSALAARRQPDVPQALLFGATRSEVCDVWCAGRAALSEGRLLAFDAAELAQLLARWTQRLKLEVAA